MILSHLHRESMLFSFGFAHDDLDKAKKVVDKNRKQRRRSKTQARIRDRKNNIVLWVKTKCIMSRRKIDKSSVSPLDAC